LDQERSIKIDFKTSISIIGANFAATVNLMFNFSRTSSVSRQTNKSKSESDTYSDNHKKRSDESILLMPKRGPGVVVTREEEFRRSRYFCPLNIQSIPA